MDATQLGNRIQQLRKEKGMTQEDLAEKTGLSVRTIQRIESGEVDPRNYTLHQIAEALDVEIRDLIKDQGTAQAIAEESANRKWLTILHLSGLLVLLLPPLLIWILKRDTVSGMDRHGKDVMNFQLSMWIYLFVTSFSFIFAASMQPLFAVGLILMPLLGIFSTLVILINTIRVAGGNNYNYPLSIKFMK